MLLVCPQKLTLVNVFSITETETCAQEPGAPTKSVCHSWPYREKEYINLPKLRLTMGKLVTGNWKLVLGVCELADLV